MLKIIDDTSMIMSPEMMSDPSTFLRLALKVMASHTGFMVAGVGSFPIATSNVLSLEKIRDLDSKR